MPNEVDKFLEDLSGDSVQDDPFKSKSEDPFAVEEKKGETIAEGEEGDKSKDEKPLPFNRDPKVLKFIEKEVAKKLEGFKPPVSGETERFVEETRNDKDDKNNDLVSAFTTVIGNDTPEKLNALKELSRAIGTMKKEAVSEAMREIESIAKREKEEEARAETELSEGFERVEEAFEVDLTSNTPQAVKTRNAFVEFIRRVAPKDSEGEVKEFPDFEETFKLFKESNKTAANTRSKDLASRSMNRSTDATVAKPVTGNSWKDVDRLFSKLNQ